MQAMSATHGHRCGRGENLSQRVNRKARRLRFGLLVVGGLFAVSQTVSAYLVGPAPTLNEFAEQADLIFKGEALADEKTVRDEWFEPVYGYVARETRFKVVSVVKGEAKEGEVRFRHYDKENNSGGGMYAPQVYHFEPGRFYVVSAHGTSTSARQVLASHTSKPDLGVLRCRDGRPTTAQTLPELYWAELLALRDGPSAEDVVYAVQQWDGMSDEPTHHGTPDFPRLDVLTAVRPLLARPEPEVAQAAIRTVAAGCPYLADRFSSYGLNPGVEQPGIASMDRGVRNAGGALVWRDLVAVAEDGQGTPETRALAVRALGLVRANELGQKLDQWLKAPEAPIRAAAVLLSTDFAVPDPYTTRHYGELAADPAPEVRRCVAYAVGFMQDPTMLPILTTLGKDADRTVRQAAGESLRSFRPEVPAAQAALRADLDNPEARPLSLLALARKNPGAYLEDLAQIVERKPTPSNWTGGQIPDYTAWKLLFGYLQARPGAEVRSGKWNRYLDALEKVGNYSSSEPRDLYAFYLQRGLTERAAKYRAAANQAASYDLDYYFKMVDKDPAIYQGH